MEEEIQKSLEVLLGGGVLLYPTDTVWGLGCDATNEQAVAKIYAIKQRSESKSMIVLIDKADNVARYINNPPEVAWQLWEVADKPLTLILPNACGVAPNLLPPEKTMAIRIVDNEFCKKLIARLARPLVSTSANISGQPTPATFEQIEQQIKAAADYVVSPAMATGATGQSSSIIKLGTGGEISIIRK